MTHESQVETDLIDLGAVSDKTHGNGGSIVPDAPQMRQLTGILAD